MIILNQAGDWYKIQGGKKNSVGYVRSKYIKLLPANVDPNAFPKDSCGDNAPDGSNLWYPVLVVYSSENLDKIHSRYCRDAFKTTYEGNTYIQVAAFLSESEAKKFSQFMIEIMGSGWVGEITEH